MCVPSWVSLLIPFRSQFFPMNSTQFCPKDPPQEDLRDLGLGMVERRRVLRWAMSAEPQPGGEWAESHF